MEVREKDDETTSSNGNNVDNNRELEEQVWGTLEELLLVCAVNRHGTNSWDSIAVELQKRIKHSSNEDEDDDEGGVLESSSFSSRNCRKKYVHLKRRFCHDGVEGNDNGEEGDGEDDGEGERHVLRMVDELRKLRVEELKRQVHHHDASIVSLQLKVKKLEEERERTRVKEEREEEGEDTVLSDLRKKPEENVRLNGEKPDEPVEKVVTGDSAENRSCNESNSTNHHHNHKTAVADERESKLKCEEPDPVQAENNNSNNKNTKKRKSEPVGGVESKMSRLIELGESLSESRKESTKQQSSDVQSSASLSKKKRRRFRGGGDNNNSGDELEAEELSPANKRINAKSQPLIRFFDTLRSHKHGSVFNRRLPSQETEKFRNVIRQHLDLDTVQSRLDKGIYCDCHPKFYRDLLLIFTNAVLFYRKSTAEHIAARELRKMVIDEINQKTRKPKIQPRKPDLDPQHLEPAVKKPRSTTMVPCRKRSSSSMQGLSDSMKKGDTNNTSAINGKNNVLENGGEEKVKPDLLEKKPNGNSSSNNNSSLSSKEKESNKGGSDTSLKKFLMRERSSLSNGGLRKIVSKDGNKREKIGSLGKEESSDGDKVQVGERKKASSTDSKQEKTTPTILKKQGVANFLKRMKQNSPSSQEKTKNNDSDEEEETKKKGKKQKTPQSAMNGNVKKKNTKEVELSVPRRSSSRRGEMDATASRRGIGRPPKRKAAMVSGGTLDSGKGGRSGGRDSSEKVKKKPRR